MKFDRTLFTRQRVAAGAASAALVAGLTLATTSLATPGGGQGNSPQAITAQLRAELTRIGFTGNIESTLAARLGRTPAADGSFIDPKLANVGRMLWFDKAAALHDDNHCGGCHAPQNGMGDTQSIAIGIQSNGRVGPNRAGPRNQRRTPMVLNAAFLPKLMWNGRFFAPTNDPFSNAQGFTFPLPEGITQFPPAHPTITHLLIAQAHIPPTELTEAAGFTGTKGTISPRFDPFDDGKGTAVPLPDASGFRNEPIRQKVLEILNASTAYRTLFGEAFADVAGGAPIDFTHFGRAIAEFEFSLTRANAPLDRFARGDDNAMTLPQKRGALVFFGKGGCVACHAVAGASNEMFSDFQNRNIAVPQIAPVFGVGKGNVIFDGPGEDEDFGAEQVTGNPDDRYKFRTAPLRNVGLQPAFFHNGAFKRLEDAIRHHLDVRASVARYQPARAGVDRDLRQRPVGPSQGQLDRLDPLLASPVKLSSQEFNDLVHFVRYGLLDERAKPQQLCRLIPASVPSGKPQLKFEGCSQGSGSN